MKRKLFLVLTLCVFTLHHLWALGPEREYKIKPDEYGITYEEITINTEDGLKLKGWLYKPRNPSTKIIVLSNSGDGNMADLIELATNFVTLDYYVITYDYRGYGESSDFKINNNFYIYAQFEKDLNAVMDYVKKYHSRTRTVHMWGVGMGAGLSLAVAANRPEVSAVIADSPYGTLEGIKANIQKANGKDMLLPIGYNKVAIEPQYALTDKGNNLTSILFIAGDADQVYTVKDIKALAKLKKNTSVYTVKGGTYKNNFTTDKAKYFEEIKKFTK